MRIESVIRLEFSSGYAGHDMFLQVLDKEKKQWVLTSQKKSNRAMASNDKIPDMMVLYQEQCRGISRGIREVFKT